MKKALSLRAALPAASLLLSYTVAMPALVMAPKAAFAQSIVVKSGEKVAFLGDSITQGGTNNPLGYVRLVLKGLEANGVKAEGIFAGVSGHKSNDMLARLDRDVLNKKPQWMTLSCGVNDVWHGERGVNFEDYKKNITAILDKTQAAGVKPIVLTSTLIREDVDNDLNKKAVPYNDFLREIAKERNLPLADLNADFRAARAALPPEDQKKGTVLTSDGVHMNFRGDQIMALGVLRAMGLSQAELDKAQAAWQEIPGLPLKTVISPRNLERLKAEAARQKKSVDELANEAVQKYVSTLPAN